jgi:hypothetical protein
LQGYQIKKRGLPSTIGAEQAIGNARSQMEGKWTELETRKAFPEFPEMESIVVH